jgi:hypothetical protein
MDASGLLGPDGFSLQQDNLMWSHAAYVKEKKRSEAGPIKYYITGQLYSVDGHLHPARSSCNICASNEGRYQYDVKTLGDEFHRLIEWVGLFRKFVCFNPLNTSLFLLRFIAINSNSSRRLCGRCALWRRGSLREPRKYSSMPFEGP